MANEISIILELFEPLFFCLVLFGFINLIIDEYVWYKKEKDKNSEMDDGNTEFIND